MESNRVLCKHELMKAQQYVWTCKKCGCRFHEERERKGLIKENNDLKKKVRDFKHIHKLLGDSIINF